MDQESYRTFSKYIKQQSGFEEVEKHEEHEDFKAALTEMIPYIAIFIGCIILLTHVDLLSKMVDPLTKNCYDFI